MSNIFDDTVSPPATPELDRALGDALSSLADALNAITSANRLREAWMNEAITLEATPPSESDPLPDLSHLSAKDG